MIGAAVLGVAPTASVDASAADKETARRLMSDARAARERNDSRGALEKFRAADAIMHVPTTGLEVARTHVALNELLEARDVALAVTRLPVVADEPAPFAEARIAAKALSDELEGRISGVSISIKGHPDTSRAVVKVDDAVIPPAALIVPRRLNPGKHVVVAQIGADSKREEFVLEEKETKELALELMPPDVAPPPAPAPPTKPTRDRRLTYVGFGVAGAGVLIGSITGLLAVSAKNSALSGCAGNRCPPATYGDIDSAETFATVSTISFIVGAIGAGVGVYSILAPRGDAKEAPKAQTSALRVSPWIAPSFGAAGLSGSF